MQGGTKQASKQAGKQASKPSFSLPSLGGKAKQASKQANKQAPKATFSLPSLGGKAEQVGKTAKVKAGSAPQKAKKAASSGASFFGTGSTRGKSSAPAKGGGLLGTRSTKPGTQSTKAGTRSTRPGAPYPHVLPIFVCQCYSWQCQLRGRLHFRVHNQVMHA